MATPSRPLIAPSILAADFARLADEAAAVEGADFAKLREGSEMTLRMLAAAMGKFGLVEIDPAGEKFNPERHEALAMAPVPGVEPNSISAPISTNRPSSG